MSLSTQYVRAALALPMLLGFAALAAFAEAPQASLPTPVASAAALPQLCPVGGTRSHVIVLAQAPADLGTLAIRWRAPCRA